MAAPRNLTVLYDERCALCRRCRDWLLTQPCLLPVGLVPAGSVAGEARYASVEPWLGKELVVMDDAGRSWVGPAAFLTCLWATARYRSASYTLSRPGLSQCAERFFMFVSKRRDRFGRWVQDTDDCSYCDAVIISRNPS